MPDPRYLIVNADDFGLSPGVNQGVIDAHERGIVTSASLMVRYPAAEAAAAYARNHAELGTGLHVDLYEWACRDGSWEMLYQVVPPDDAAAVSREVARQLALFRALTGRDPTHLDSHQHAHNHEPLRTVMLELAARLGVPLRHHTPGVRYCGDFYGQDEAGYPFPEGISPENLLRVLASLPPGVTELACHPGYGDDIGGMYRAERAQEVAALCDPRARDAVRSHGITLGTFPSRPRE